MDDMMESVRDSVRTSVIKMKEIAEEKKIKENVQATSEGLVTSAQLIWNSTSDGISEIAQASKRGKDKLLEKTKETDEKLKAKGIDVGAGVKKTTNVLIEGAGAIAMGALSVGN